MYKLLGGKIHDTHPHLHELSLGQHPADARCVLRSAPRSSSRRAPRAGKYDPFGAYPGPDRQLSTTVLNEVREMIRGIREAGPTFDICVEAHGKFNMATAGRIIKMLEPFDPFFLEEPVPPENMEAMAALAGVHQHPDRHGRGHSRPFQLCATPREAGRAHPSARRSRTGGITAMKKIAAMADAHYVTFAPHNPNGPVCTAASIHVAASSRTS